jgi:hypothetical protein
MAKCAALVSLGLPGVHVLARVAFGQLDSTGTSLTPTAGEIAILVLALSMVAAVTYGLSYVLLRLRRQRSERARPGVRSAAPPRARRSPPAG